MKNYNIYIYTRGYGKKTGGGGGVCAGAPRFSLFMYVLYT